MCEECTKLEKKIARYREFLNRGFDPLTEERLAQAIKELEQKKAPLH
jgi:hypothetical protein